MTPDPIVGPNLIINLGNRVARIGKIKNLCTTFATSHLAYAAPNAIIDSIAVTHMEWRVA